MSEPLQPQSHRETAIVRRPLAESTARGEYLTGRVIACPIELHRRPGPALAESIYPSALAVNSRTHGIRYQRQAAVPANDRGKVIGAHKLDFIAGNTVALGPLGDVPYRLLREGVKRSFSETYLSAASGSPWLTCFRQCWI